MIEAIAEHVCQRFTCIMCSPYVVAMQEIINYLSLPRAIPMDMKHQIYTFIFVIYYFILCIYSQFPEMHQFHSIVMCDWVSSFMQDPEACAKVCAVETHSGHTLIHFNSFHSLYKMDWNGQCLSSNASMNMFSVWLQISQCIAFSLSTNPNGDSVAILSGPQSDDLYDNCN